MAKKIKVLHTEWSDGWGGQEIRIINEMIAIRERGIEVFLACKEDSVINKKAIENNITVFTLPFSGNADLKTIFLLKKIIKKYQINIVNTHSGKDTWVGGIAAKLSGAKFIRTRHLSNPIRASRLNFINEMADYIFTTGTQVKDAMIKNNRINSNKIESIPTGIDENIFNPSKINKQESRKLFCINDKEIAIGIVAVLRKSKRHDNFVKIALKLNIDFPDKVFKFFIAGNGPQYNDIQQQIKNLNISNITMLGHIENVEHLLSALDLFVFTSDIGEGVPQSVMQALCMEKIVITTNDGSTRDLYNKKNMLLSDTNINNIYNNIKDILNKQISINVDRQFIVDNFSLKVLTDKTISIYQGMLN